MIDLALNLQMAIRTALGEDTAISALIGDRIYDRVPENPDFPYLTFGDVQVIPEPVADLEIASAFVTIHIWSRAVGQVECKSVGRAVIARLHQRSITLESGMAQMVFLESAHYLADPDGLTSHGVVAFEILTDSND